MKVLEPDLNRPQLFKKGEMNDLTRYLDLSKGAAQLFGHRLHSRQLLSAGIQFA